MEEELDMRLLKEYEKERKLEVSAAPKREASLNGGWYHGWKTHKGGYPGVVRELPQYGKVEALLVPEYVKKLSPYLKMEFSSGEIVYMVRTTSMDTKDSGMDIFVPLGKTQKMSLGGNVIIKGWLDDQVFKRYEHRCVSVEAEKSLISLNSTGVHGSPSVEDEMYKTPQPCMFVNSNTITMAGNFRTYGTGTILANVSSRVFPSPGEEVIFIKQYPSIMISG